MDHEWDAVVVAADGRLWGKQNCCQLMTVPQPGALFMDWTIMDSLLSFVYRENFVSISEIVEARTCCSLLWVVSLHD